MREVQWYQRLDGLWNGFCPCGATLAGMPGAERPQAQTNHRIRCIQCKDGSQELEGDEVIIEFINRLKVLGAVVAKYVSDGSKGFFAELRKEWTSDFGTTLVRIWSFQPAKMRWDDLGCIRLSTTLRNGLSVVSLSDLPNHEQFNHVMAHFELGKRNGEIPSFWDRLENA